MNAKPVKVGVLVDYMFPPPGRFDMHHDFTDAVQLTMEEAHETGLLDRPVELITRNVDGLPTGEAKVVLDAWKELADEGCVCIFGPMISDNALAVRDYIENEGKIPTLVWAGSEDFHGEWCFSIPQGSFPEEPNLIVNYLVRHDARRIALGYEDSLIGRGYLQWFRRAAAIENLEIVSELATPQLFGDYRHIAEAWAPHQPDAVVQLGIGVAATCLNQAFTDVGWEPPIKVTNMGFTFAYITDDFMRQLAGWVGCDQYDERNPTTNAFLDRFEKRFGRRPEYFIPGYAHDGSRLITHALAGAHPLTPAGVKTGFEDVKLLPSASGTADTRLSFGKYMRRAWHGAGFLVLRQVVPEGTHTVFAGALETPGV